MSRSPREIVLFLHGTSGSAQRDKITGKITWGRPRYFLAYANYYCGLNPWHEGQTDRTEVGPIIDTVWLCKPLGWGVSIYANTFKHLTEEMGYVRGDLSDLSPEANFYPFAYDWRQTMTQTARELDAVVDRLIAFHENPDLKITLICHSNGGLIGRHWFARGAGDDWEADDPPPPTFPRQRNLGRLVLVGTPNLGAIKLLAELSGGITPAPPFGLRYKPDYLFSVPPLYESLPLETEGLFLDESDSPVTVNLADVDEWRNHRFGVYHEFPGYLEDERATKYLRTTLLRAQRFKRALQHPWPSEIQEHMHIVASRDFPTCGGLRIRRGLLDVSEATRLLKAKEWSPKNQGHPLLKDGDWFGTWESLTGFAHPPQNLHQVHCPHRMLFNDPKTQDAIGHALKD